MNCCAVNGKVITVAKIREDFSKLNGADFTEPVTAGIFVSIAAWASSQRSEDETIVLCSVLSGRAAIKCRAVFFPQR